MFPRIITYGNIDSRFFIYVATSMINVSGYKLHRVILIVDFYIYYDKHDQMSHCKSRL